MASRLNRGEGAEAGGTRLKGSMVTGHTRDSALVRQAVRADADEGFIAIRAAKRQVGVRPPKSVAESLPLVNGGRRAPLPRPLSARIRLASKAPGVPMPTLREYADQIWDGEVDTVNVAHPIRGMWLTAEEVADGVLYYMPRKADPATPRPTTVRRRPEVWRSPAVIP